MLVKQLPELLEQNISTVVVLSIVKSAKMERSYIGCSEPYSRGVIRAEVL